MKSHKRFSTASGSTKRLVEKIVAGGGRSVRRQFVDAERTHRLARINKNWGTTDE
jgi:hypothetical protein